VLNKLNSTQHLPLRLATVYVLQELFDRGLSTSSLEPRRIMDELQYMPASSEETISVPVSPLLKPGVGPTVNSLCHQLSYIIMILPARCSKRGICYGNVAGCVYVCHTPVLYQNE